MNHIPMTMGDDMRKLPTFALAGAILFAAGTALAQGGTGSAGGTTSGGTGYSQDQSGTLGSSSDVPQRGTQQGMSQQDPSARASFGAQSPSDTSKTQRSGISGLDGQQDRAQFGSTSDMEQRERAVGMTGDIERGAYSYEQESGTN